MVIAIVLLYVSAVATILCWWVRSDRKYEYFRQNYLWSSIFIVIVNNVV